MTESIPTYTAGATALDDQTPLQSGVEWQLGHRSSRLLAIRLRDARTRYEQVFDHPPPVSTINALDGWDQVASMEQAIAEVHIPKGPGTYTPPSPYRVFKVVAGKHSG